MFCLVTVSASITGTLESSKATKTEKPYFDNVGPRNVTAVVGQSALLKCRVKSPGDRTVSELNFLFWYYPISQNLLEIQISLEHIKNCCPLGLVVCLSDFRNHKVRKRAGYRGGGSRDLGKVGLTKVNITLLDYRDLVASYELKP